MKYIILSLFSLLAFNICAQVRGIVKDNTGEPVPGANIFWLTTGQGVTTKEDGSFSIYKPAKEHMLVVSFIGFRNDTIHVSGKNDELDIVLQDGVELNEISVVRRKMGTMKIRNSVLNEDIITSAELSRAACCNLGESFVTNPSVDVSYSDAATGAKQIKLLGLSGTYVQMLTENIPNYRGAASPYGLGYIPGPWMQSIQVSKGTSSVKNGYEAITGQINVEFKKPQLPEADWVFANLFASSTNRYEANADATLKVSKRWSTSLLAHYENETKAHDGNNDGFVDIPQVEQYNIWNRWAYMGDHYVFQAGFKALSESRNSGQTHHGNMLASDLYKVGIDTERYELFTKNAYIFNKEKNTNLALILSATWHNQDALYGKKLYNVDQTNLYASLMFETELNKQNSISAGLSFNYDAFDQHYRLENDAEGLLRKAFDKEAVPGAYVQYTLNLNDQWMFMAGLRGDYSSEHGFFMTPRAHLKYNPNEYVHFRLSAGKGYRASVATYIPIFGKTLNVNAEYYYTNFLKQVIVDMDSNPHEVSFYNLDGRSYSHVFQIEASYPFFKGFTLTGAYRLTDVQTTYKGQRMEKPLTSKYKGLLTASYQTPMGIWQFDATLQLNGSGRMPSPYELTDGRLSWERRYGSFEQVSAQITRYFRRWSIYVGGENLTNFKQKNPIIDASNPWGDNFDSTMIWGPVHGAKAYIGVRFNLARN